MGLKQQKITPGNKYIRRRDKLLVEVTKTEGMNVHYTNTKTGAECKVSFGGFKQGFRPATAEESA